MPTERQLSRARLRLRRPRKGAAATPTPQPHPTPTPAAPSALATPSLDLSAFQSLVDVAQAGVQRDLPAVFKAKGFELPEARAVQALGGTGGRKVAGRAENVPLNLPPLVSKIAALVGVLSGGSKSTLIAADVGKQEITQSVRHEAAHFTLAFQGQKVAQHHETIRAASFPRSGRGVQFGQLEVERVARKVGTPEQLTRATKGRQRLLRSDIRRESGGVSRAARKLASPFQVSRRLRRLGTPGAPRGGGLQGHLEGQDRLRLKFANKRRKAGG